MKGIFGVLGILFPILFCVDIVQAKRHHGNDRYSPARFLERLDRDRKHSDKREKREKDEDEKQIARLKRKIQEAKSADEFLTYSRQLEIMLKNQGEVRLQKLKNGEYHCEAFKNAAEALHGFKKTKIKAKAQKEAAIESANIWASKLTNPLILGLASLAICLSYQATKVGAEFLHRWLSIPPLAQKTSIRTVREKMFGYFSSPEEEYIPLEDVKLEPELTTHMAQLAETVKNTAAHDGYFRHFLFYGPPGSGKTMLAMSIALNAGLDYIYFAASKLEQYSEEEALKQLVQLFEYAKKRKCLIIMDEAEVFFGKREVMKDKTRKLLGAFLAYAGTVSKYFMVIALSNKPHMFDEAALNRFGEQIYIGAPDLDERKRILELHIKKFLLDAAQPAQDTRGLIRRMLFKAPESKVLWIDEGALDQEVLDDIAEKTDQFVGRDIADLCLAIQGAAYASEHFTLTKDIVYKSLQNKIVQKQQELNNFQEVPQEKG